MRPGTDFRRLLLALALLALPALASAGLSGQAGTSGAQFLKLGAGGRAGGMADAFSAIADDAYASYYNPAGLSQLKEPQIGGAHTAYFQGINYEVVDFAYPWGIEKDYSRHALSLGVYQLSVSGIQRFTSDSTDNVGTFNASDAAYALTYGHAVTRRLSAGVTAKYISQTLDSYHSSAYTFDGGVLYHMNPDAARPVTFAAVVKNFNMGLSRTGYAAGNSDPLPMEVTFGAASPVVPKRINVDFEVSQYRDSNPFVSLGAEYMTQINEALGTALRLGYTSQRSDSAGLNGLSMGAGLSFKKASFDFAWVPFGNLGDTFRYSLLVKF